MSSNPTVAMVMVIWSQSFSLSPSCRDILMFCEPPGVVVHNMESYISLLNGCILKILINEMSTLSAAQYFLYMSYCIKNRDY